MTSCDTNILFYIQNEDCSEHQAARTFIGPYIESEEFAICELVLIELYVLLRNPKLLDHPLSPSAAVDVIQIYRSNPHWRILDYPGNLMKVIWKLARSPHFGRNQIFDTKIALTLQHHGVRRFATRNTKHFNDHGLKIINPID